MLYRQTFAALRRATGIDCVVVATNDTEIAGHAHRSGALVFDEREQVSHSVSADAACLRAVTLGAKTALLVPIDVPLATPDDFSQLAAKARPGVIIVPSADGTGTNALVRTPPDVIESRFGPGSCQAHLDQARLKNVPAEILPLHRLMFDIDTPEDIFQLLAGSHDSDVAAFLRSACASK